MVRVLFVCTGNICRSPSAEGVFRVLVEDEGLGDRVEVDSAGTHGYHKGEAPDPRSQAAAAKRGLDLSEQRARQVSAEDFATFDHIVAMDRSNHKILERIQPRNARAKLSMMLNFWPEHGREDGDVPDPYYGEGDGFEVVLNLLEGASRGLLEELKRGPLAD